MNSPKLRPYQQNILEQARTEVARGNRSVLIYLPMGGGKSLVAAEMFKSAFSKGYRAIFLAHRRELVKQAARVFEGYGLTTTILMAGHEFDTSAQLVVASQQTWDQRHEWLDKEYSLIIIDEAHIGLRRQQRIIKDIRDSAPKAVVVGLTATPMTNGNGPGLGSIYQTLVHGPTFTELTEMGYLVPAEHYMMQPIEWRPDAVMALNSTGEYDTASVENWFKEFRVLGDIVQNWEDNFYGLPTIVFARSVRQSIWIAEAFGNRGIPAAHIDFRTPEKERERILSDFRAGNIAVLSNVDIFSEGFDMPDIRVAILATPMRSLTRYIQRVGRALRPAPGKDKAIVVDHGGVLQEHGTIYRFQHWTLEPPRPNRVNPYHALKMKKDTPMRRCPMCGHEFEAGPTECPQCKYDFYRLPPGVEPPIVPAVMVEYQELMRLEAAGIKKKCKGVRLPVGYTLERLYGELLGLADEYSAKRVKQGKRPWSRRFIDNLFYSAVCKHPDGLIDKYKVKKLPPTEVVKKIMRRYFTLKVKGYFSRN